MSLADTILAIQTVIATVDGVRAAPEYAPDRLPPGIFSVALPSSGLWRVEPARTMRGLHSIEIDIICPRIDLPKTLQSIIPLGDAVALALITDLLSDSSLIRASCDTFGDITYRFSTSINLGSQTDPAYYSGWVFTMQNVKVLDVIN